MSRSQRDVDLSHSASQASRDLPLFRHPYSLSHRDAISAAHPTSDNVDNTPIHSMRSLSPPRPPSPRNTRNDESDCEEDDDLDIESLLATQPPEITFTATTTIPPGIFAANDYKPLDDSDYPPIPTEISTAIELMLQDVWGIPEPREYQVRAIFYMAFLKTRLMYLVHKTGEGKSLVLLGTATILRGVTVCLVPLLGLGSSHASNSICEHHCVEGYHVDEYRDQDFEALSARMDRFSRREETSIILYISPQNLQLSSKWYRLLSGLAGSGLISFVCIDEAHACVEQGESFCPEFKSSINALKSLIATIEQPTLDVPVLAMSATFRIPDQKAFNTMIGDFPELVMWGGMNRRNVGIFASVAGEPLSRLIHNWVHDVTNDPTMQSLIMSNSAAACDGRIIDRLEKAAAKLPRSVRGEVPRLFMPFTGDSGLVLKMFLMACFCAEDSTNPLLVDIWCMPCTAAAHCGVSSKRNKQCYRYGPVPSMHDMIQEAGRVDRLHNAPPNLQCYNIFLNVTTFVLLWVRIQAEANVTIRHKNERHLFEVLQFIITPTKCYHEAVKSTSKIQKHIIQEVLAVITAPIVPTPMLSLLGGYPSRSL
eukprot:CCRYP_003053-RA/>CCRYP_003053-RA protein AED:0.68 eAED:0.43 QI:0/0/0/0.5/1/1/2/0/593